MRPSDDLDPLTGEARKERARLGAPFNLLLVSGGLAALAGLVLVLLFMYGPA